MNAVAPRHGTVSDFLALTDGLSIARVAEILRCCTRTIRNYVAGRSPIPWHRVELLRMIARESNRAAAGAGTPTPAPVAQQSAVVANIEPDPASPDVPPDEMLAWVGVHAPHYLSSQRSFAHYVRGWNVVDKIRRAKRDGTFAAVLARWRTLSLELPRMWRTGPLWSGIGPPAYMTRNADR
ncbi:IS21 family transposase [Burkholderia ubonensis]|uniref:IS21 family transposase n=1 Tax=Burkholderia ubonensis TaxID=101571 RepID=UPI000BA65A66|nr:IS21 family transposase [Burkholderia ubonensis]PAJ83723.1 IS21 family transposase [Burkholderia ubonensis]PAJ87914.1 IS21 family transposase [Burkholderia ubonensis]PAJ97735.1 IS21 family transposase [Burkholderia ubonensis]PAK03824.1 IS21 family transposase [Burkholderia ubonensis]PAK08120.1 IS21 family transposase [Burkholderia ubonensis]